MNTAQRLIDTYGLNYIRELLGWKNGTADQVAKEMVKRWLNDGYIERSDGVICELRLNDQSLRPAFQI